MLQNSEILPQTDIPKKTDLVGDSGTGLLQVKRKTTQINWKEFCCKFGTFKQISNGKYNYFFVCSCGIQMVDNKTSVVYHLVNVCKVISGEDRKTFMTLLDDYHKENPIIPKRKMSEWKALATCHGEFKRHYNKKIYQCNCGLMLSYKKYDVISHLTECSTTDRSVKDTVGTFIKSNQSNVRVRKSKKSKENETKLQLEKEAINIPKLKYPPSDKKRIILQLERNIEELTATVEINEHELQRLESILITIEELNK